MITRIVLAGGGEVEVPLHVEQVRDALQRDGQDGRLSEFELTEPDGSGDPVRIYINRDQVAFIMDAGLAARALEKPPEDESRDDSASARRGRRGEPVTDIWGNPIRPKRKRR